MYCTEFSKKKLLEDVTNDMITIKPLYTGGLFHCHTLDKSICHFRGVGPFPSLLLCFDGNSC